MIANRTHVIYSNKKKNKIALPTTEVILPTQLCHASHILKQKCLKELYESVDLTKVRKNYVGIKLSQQNKTRRRKMLFHKTSRRQVQTTELDIVTYTS